MWCINLGKFESVQFIAPQRDCPSGQLSKKKFIEVYSGFFPDGNAEEFCTHVFRTFDKDNSGRIDFKEFLLAINITSGGDPEEKLEWAYQMYDIDGNGTIERAEMVEIIHVSCVCVGRRWSLCFFQMLKPVIYLGFNLVVVK